MNVQQPSPGHRQNPYRSLDSARGTEGTRRRSLIITSSGVAAVNANGTAGRRVMVKGNRMSAPAAKPPATAAHNALKNAIERGNKQKNTRQRAALNGNRCR